VLGPTLGVTAEVEL